MQALKSSFTICAVLILALFFLTTTCVDAQDHQQRERWQRLNSEVRDAQAKINAGLRDGSLTKPEAERLRNELRRVDSDMKRAGRDGISREEMDRLEREFAKLRQDIYRERRDQQRAPQRERWQRLHNEIRDAHARINAGVRDRSLTKPEADRLREELRRIEGDMKRAKQDGISRDEMERLEREFARLRQDIYRERHDQDRPPQKKR